MRVVSLIWGEMGPPPPTGPAMELTSLGANESVGLLFPNY